MRRLSRVRSDRASTQRAVDGHIASGRQLATPRLLNLEDELRAIVKVDLWPGTLNVVLKEPLRLRDDVGSSFDSNDLMVWPASVDGIDVWLYRWQEAPLHIVEILASTCLRERLNLRDGDSITLRLSDDQIAPIHSFGRLVWAAVWLRRRHWFYERAAYYHNNNRRRIVFAKLGAAQQHPVGAIRTSFWIASKVAKRTPVVRVLAENVNAFIRSKTNGNVLGFTRLSTNDCAGNEERLFRQICNVLNYTKTSNSTYSAQNFAAGYHTLTIGGQTVLGQRDPAKRLQLVPIEFREKTVLDLGCNQGGMIHQLKDRVKWAVGIDYDPRMINAANKLVQATGARNCAFYVLDLQKEPLELISDFLPEEQVDVCFLLSVCMWLDNWRDVIDFAQSKSRAMLFETNGSSQQQEQQIRYLHSRYRVVDLLAETSEDDPGQKRRKLLYLTRPIDQRESLADPTIAGPAALRDLVQAAVTAGP